MLPMLVFVVVAGLIVGVYLVVSSMPGAVAQRTLERRLLEVSAPVHEGDAATPTIVRRALEGPLPGVERLVSRTQVGSRLALLIEQSGVQTSPSGVLLVSTVAAVVCGLLTAMFVRQAIAVPIAAVAGGLVPFGWLRRRRTVRFKRFEEQFPEALDVLSRAVRAGHAFQTALSMAAEELPAPVGPEFRKTFDQQNFGLPLRDALNQLSDRITLVDVRFFVTAVLIQRESGGNLAEILDNLARVVRERFKIQRQVRVHTAHGRFTGYVLLALPAFLAITLSIINPEHMAPLFKEHLGHVMLTTVLIMQVVGYVWIRKVIKIEV